MAKLETFSQRLAQLRREKAAREFREVDQEEIAKAIGLSEKQQPYISKWENDTTPKDDELVQRLADYYGVTFLWLRHGKGERTAGLPPMYYGVDPLAPAKVAESAPPARTSTAKKSAAKKSGRRKAG